MSVLDRLQNYSANKKQIKSEIFDTTTPDGYFLTRLHEQGYRMYDYTYEDNSGNVISSKQYNCLSDDEKSKYSSKLHYTELHDMLTTSGDQLVLANAGSGKALSNDTKVLTEKGYVPIGSLTTDDKVYGIDLNLYSIKGIYPQGKKNVNVLTISNGVKSYTVNCCDEHLWSIKSETGIETISTKDIISRLSFESSIPLVDLTPFSGCTDTDFDIELFMVKLIASFEEDSLIEAIRHAYYKMDSDSFIHVGKLSAEHFHLLHSLSKYLKGKGIYCTEGTLYVYREVTEKYILSDVYKNSKLYDNLVNLANTSVSDFLGVLDKENCSYSITNIEVTDSETEMTCIEVDSDNHLFLLEGLIPTHNTTALIFKIMYDIITGEATKLTSIPNGTSVRVVDSIFVGTFLNSGTKELSERLAYWQRGLGYTVTADQVNFSTLHAEFKRALNSMGAATPIGKQAEINKCLRTAINNLGITNCGSSLTSEDYNVIGGIITYYRGRLDNKRYNHQSARDYGLTPVLLDRLVSDFANQRQLAGIMDYEDLQELLYKFLYVTPNKAVQDFCANRYNYMYIDEFQDTSQIQYAILKFYARGRLWINRGTTSEEDKNSQLYTGNETLGKIVVVGDNDQCLYQWRGSDNNIIETEFDNDFRPCHSSLSYNYRCPSNILNAIVPSIKNNKGHESREYHSSFEGGIVKGYSFKNYTAMLNHLLSCIDTDMQEGNKVAILCRTNYDGVIPAFMLEASKKYNFSISGLNMTFDSPLPKKLIAISSIFTERCTQSVKNTLSMFVPRFAEWSVKQLVDTLRNNNKTIWQLPEVDIDYSCPELLPMIKDIKRILYVNNKRDTTKEIPALKFVYQWVKVNTYGGRSLFCESARAYIDALLLILEQNDFESVFDFVDYINSINERLHARVNNSKADICITTVHEFKGKERDSVIVWDDSEGVFPSSKINLDNIDELEGERMVHYVACTRARKKSIVFTRQGREGMFVREMNLQLENPVKVGGSLSVNTSEDKELSEDEKNLLNVMQTLSEKESE